MIAAAPLWMFAPRRFRSHPYSALGIPSSFQTGVGSFRWVTRLAHRRVVLRGGVVGSKDGPRLHLLEDEVPALDDRCVVGDAKTRLVRRALLVLGDRHGALANGVPHQVEL